jgi:hypothetical protein
MIEHNAYLGQRRPRTLSAWAKLVIALCHRRVAIRHSLQPIVGGPQEYVQREAEASKLFGQEMSVDLTLK